MNKIIHSAAISALGKCWAFHPLREKKVTEFTDAESIQFAEFIVLECCNTINAYKQGNNPHDWPLVLNIKDQFGLIV